MIKVLLDVVERGDERRAMGWERREATWPQGGPQTNDRRVTNKRASGFFLQVSVYSLMVGEAKGAKAESVSDDDGSIGMIVITFLCIAVGAIVVGTVRKMLDAVVQNAKLAGEIHLLQEKVIDLTYQRDRLDADLTQEQVDHKDNVNFWTVKNTRLEDELDRVRGQWKCRDCGAVNERHSEDCWTCANRTPGTSSTPSATTMPPPIPPTSRQVSYIRVLAGRMGVTVPADVFTDKAVATLWLDRHAGRSGR